MMTLALVSMLCAAPTFSAAGKAVDPDGKPVANLYVTVMAIQEPSLNPDPPNLSGTKTDAAGNFTLSGIPAGRYALAASAKASAGSALPAQRGAAKFTVVDANVTGLVLKLVLARAQSFELTGQGDLVPEIAADKRLGGRLLLSNGKPAPEGVEVVVVCTGSVSEEPGVKCGGSWGPSLSPQGRKATTDADGRFVAEGLPRAKYTVVAEHAGEKGELPVELHDSISNAELKLQPETKRK